VKQALLAPALAAAVAVAPEPREDSEPRASEDRVEPAASEAAAGPSVDREEPPAAATPPDPVPTPSPAPPPPGPAVAQAATATVRPTPQILITIQNLEEDVTALEGFRPLLERIRREVTLPADGAPPSACASGLRDEIAAVIRQGTTVIASDARGFRGQLDDLCRRFERWSEPGAGQQNRMRRYVAHLDRIDEWMRDIRRCIDPGPYDGRCENAYGSQEPGDAEQARRAMRTVTEVRGILEGVPERRPFPCRSPLWDRIEQSRWTMTVARAQIPGLATQARSICESLGVEQEALERVVQRTRESVDRAIASEAHLATIRRTSLAQMRATFGIPAPPD
jgi:hypothetical protein